MFEDCFLFCWFSGFLDVIGSYSFLGFLVFSGCLDFLSVPDFRGRICFSDFIMLLLAFMPLLIGEKMYHLLKKTGAKQLLMAAILSFLAIDIFIIINDLLEADKIGPFFFLNAAIITYFGIEVKKEASKDKLENF